MTARKILMFLFFLCLSTRAFSKILVRWTQPIVPPAKALAVSDLVIAWSPDSPTFIESAHKEGFRVFVQTRPEQITQIVNSAKGTLAGVIVELAAAQQSQADKVLQDLRSSYPRLPFLLLDPYGKQPQMKGTMVVKKDGVLEITSPTAQPWIDSNVPLVRFELGFRPSQVPLYTFQWELPDALHQKQGPSAADYSLAIAEAGALHADLILNVPDELQRSLSANDEPAWKLWNQVKPELEFAGRIDQKAVPQSNVGVLSDNYDAAYEPMNLMARHNIPFRVLPASKVNTRAFDGLKILLVFANRSPQAVGEIANFAAAGGTAVLVGLKGFYPWHTAAATQGAEHTVNYSVGKGRVIELAEPVTDPETFAQDVRRLMNPNDVLISLWNALTTIGIPYRSLETGASDLELVNYSGDPLRVQIKIKGAFRSIRYASSENCCQLLPAAHHHSFTEFVVPALKTAGRVHMSGPSR